MMGFFSSYWFEKCLLSHTQGECQTFINPIAGRLLKEKEKPCPESAASKFTTKRNPLHAWHISIAGRRE
jgi:hypothetical protein